MAQPANFLNFPEGAVAIVTGAASGIGLETAKLLVGQNVRVIGADINADGIRAVELGSLFTGIVLDTADRAAVEETLPRLRKEFGPIGYLANNAGPPSSLSLSIEEGLRQTAASVQIISAAWAATEPPEGAALVNVASVAGAVAGGPPPSVVAGRRNASTYNGWYAVGKSALTGLTRFQAVFGAGRYRANAVAPGVIETARIGDLTKGAYGQLMIERSPLGRLGQPDEVARAIVFLLSPASSFINGVTLVIDGGGTIVY